MAYDGEGRRTAITSDPAGTGTGQGPSTREFRYQGDAIVEERVDGVLDRSYLVDESGSVLQMDIPSGTGAGRYVVTWNGHGDAMALWKLDATTGGLTLANSFTYGTWGAPSVATHNSAPDLGFRFRYVGEFDVQWDGELGLGLYYMHARHYAPGIGRFLQPDPDRSEANLYAYAANNPVTEIDPDGTCFIVCQLVVGAVIDAVVYLATTENADLGGLAGAVATGAVESAVNPLAKIGKVAKLASAATKIYGKISKASRVAKSLAQSGARAGGRVRSKGHTVYFSGTAGRPDYVGITNDFARRKSEHWKAVKRSITPYSGLTNLSRFGAHSVEQALINRHGLAKNGGRLANKVNSVSRRDPLYRLYVSNGNRLLRRAGY